MNPYSPPYAAVRDPPAGVRTGLTVWVLRAIASYSVIVPIFAYVNLVELFATNTAAQRLPIYYHYFAYFVPGLLLAAGITLFLRSKLAIVLYAAYFLVAIFTPAIMYPLYSDPYVSNSLLDIYRKATSIPLVLGWVVAGGLAAYAWWLNKRGALS
jgi:hypothetical protein